MNAWTLFDKDDELVAVGRQIIGAGIRAARLGLGMSQRQLGHRALLSQSAISRLETGRLQGLRLRTMARVVGVLQASPGYVFPQGPPPPTRRLPGERAAGSSVGTAAATEAARARERERARERAAA